MHTLPHRCTTATTAAAVTLRLRTASVHKQLVIRKALLPVCWLLVQAGTNTYCVTHNGTSSTPAALSRGFLALRLLLLLLRLLLLLMRLLLLHLSRVLQASQRMVRSCRRL